MTHVRRKCEFYKVFVVCVCYSIFMKHAKIKRTNLSLISTQSIFRPIFPAYFRFKGSTDTFFSHRNTDYSYRIFFPVASDRFHLIFIAAPTFAYFCYIMNVGICTRSKSGIFIETINFEIDLALVTSIQVYTYLINHVTDKMVLIRCELYLFLLQLVVTTGNK